MRTASDTELGKTVGMAARVARGLVGVFGSRCHQFGNTVIPVSVGGGRRAFSSETHIEETNFGLFFDIDGVIMRGRTLLPTAREAFRLLTDKNGKFIVPSIFVTNAGNVMRHEKAAQLSGWLDVEVTPDQVVMSHSPLKMFRQFLDKHVLVAGQGPTVEIAQQLGFTKITTIKQLRHCFPALDTVDHKRRKTAPCAFEKYYPRIEAVILFGEPVRWETNLQLILDVLLTNGQPSEAPSYIPYPHIPVLACNMDLLWMSEACMPRFAHGAFLHCLESIYKKISGHELRYTALVGKPSEITYHHAEHVLQLEARKMGLPGLRRMYCIGDNPDVDIYGANLFHRYLQRRKEKLRGRKSAYVHQARTKTGASYYVPEEAIALMESDVDELFETDFSDDTEFIGIEECESILVCTGVYSSNRDYSQNILLDHNHRDFIMDPDLKKPTIMINNVLEAVQAVFHLQGKGS